MSSTKERRNILRQLLLSGVAGSTQDQLVEALSARGIQTTQSTVSRDLKRLGAQRQARENGTTVYRLEPTTRSDFPAEMVLSVEHNETMIVIRTHVGRAPAVGAELDDMGHPDVLGTIAGDDAVLVIPRSTSRVGALASELLELSKLS
ncbi:arginine repressor [Pseudenhygromyxa sp. WMMC2535]|uniref:arginine repressor n=1 Tax=Pseudenhygromyxa sp. WMMC2535 TaxID=2712867 RepID=UPI0015539AB1|nr:arginine repressor [Pseudenhygromyxa sp. WMMC2535]NVB36572.1 arginine repressor [Pseudenhygromyxa sp. WMMC2535]